MILLALLHNSSYNHICKRMLGNLIYKQNNNNLKCIIHQRKFHICKSYNNYNLTHDFFTHTSNNYIQYELIFHITVFHDIIVINQLIENTLFSFSSLHTHWNLSNFD